MLQGVPVLWGSFESKNANTLEKMLLQFDGEQRAAAAASSIRSEGASATQDESGDPVAQAAAAFGRLPIHLLSFEGSADGEAGPASFAEIVDTIRHAVDQYGVRHVLIDNLYFMLPRMFSSARGGGGSSSGGGGGSHRRGFVSNYEKQEMFDAVVERLRLLCVELNVTTSLDS